MSFLVTPEKLVYGGDALAHYQGRAVFVPRVLPGETAEVEVVRTAQGVSHASPVRIVEASADRIEPRCPYFGRCGGCQYQHLSDENQISAKREILRETLRRIGKIRWEDEIPVHHAQPWNYRNHAEVKVEHGSGGRSELGFFAAESHRLVAIDTCPILSPLLNLLLAELRKDDWSSRLGACREIEMFADEADARAMLVFRGPFDPQTGESLARDCLARLERVKCVAVESDRRRAVFGEPGLDYRVGNFSYRVSPGSFFQASRFLLPELVESVTAGESGSLALDLFAGVGLFALPLAKAFAQVIAVESHSGSAQDLASNAARHGLAHVQVVRRPVEDFLRRYAQAPPDLVVLDPPRAGAGRPALESLAKLLPAKIRYVSCHPPTLARDLNTLAALGFQLNSIAMFDFFPQTFHIECLADLRQTQSGNS